jgi:hypothetical protein
MPQDSLNLSKPLSQSSPPQGGNLLHVTPLVGSLNRSSHESLVAVLTHYQLGNHVRTQLDTHVIRTLKHEWAPEKCVDMLPGLTYAQTHTHAHIHRSPSTPQGINPRCDTKVVPDRDRTVVGCLGTARASRESSSRTQYPLLQVGGR